MKSNKIKLLFFITWSVLLIGIVCAEDVDTNVQPDTVFDDLTDATENVFVDADESASVVVDDVANDNKIVKNSNLTEQSVKTSSKKIKTSISTEPISDRDSSKDFYLKARVIGENNARVANANVTVSFYEIDAYYDASYGNQSVRQALEAIKDENLIILYGNVDSTTER